MYSVSSVCLLHIHFFTSLLSDWYMLFFNLNIHESTNFFSEMNIHELVLIICCNGGYF